MVDKPQGWTSHDVVNKLRGIMGERSIGHLGTLDPMATGVLPLLVGSATRLARFYRESEKVYEARVRFGFATNTYDREGEPTTEAVPVSLVRGDIEEALAPFLGVILQTPPAFSAKKIRGVPAYKLARRGEAVELKPVEVTIFALKLLEFSGDQAFLRIRCGAGTYVRSLAHDLGLALGCGAHLAELRRIESGGFVIDEAHTLSDLQQRKAENRLLEVIVPAPMLLPELPAVVVDETAAARIRVGRDFCNSPWLPSSAAPLIKAVNDAGMLLAIAEAVLPNVYHPVVVLAAGADSQSGDASQL